MRVARRWGVILGAGYRECRPSFPVVRWPILAAGSTTCSISFTIRPRCSWRSAGSRGTAAGTLPAWTGLDRRRRGADGRRSRVPGRPAGTGQGWNVSPVAGALTVDPEGPWLGKTEKSRHSDHRRSGGPGRVEAGAGTDLRGRLLPGLLRVPAEPAGPRRDRRDPAVRHPRLPLGAGRRYRGVL